MTKSSLKARFARLGPSLDIDLVQSGSSEPVALAPGADLRRVKTMEAIFALRRRGLPMLRAKRAVEAALADGRIELTVPRVESLEALAADMREAGFSIASLTPHAPNVRQLRDRLGLSQEQFALRCGLDIDAVRNWEHGRREPDTAAKSYLTIIDRDPDHTARALSWPAP
jgi:putative transcriptional regulator